MNLRRLAVKVLVFAAAAGFTGVFFIKWCDLVYQCGCTFDWLGGAAQCNIHNPGPPHCPWCSSRLYGGVAFFGTLAAQAAPIFAPGALTKIRVLAAFCASPVAAGLIGAVIGLGLGYWSS